MISKAKLWIPLCVLIILSLAACQPASPPSTDNLATAAPPAQITRTPVSFPTQQPSPTPPAHLLVDPEELDGLEIIFAVPWSGQVEQTAAGLVSEFNRTNLWGIKVSLTALGSDALLNDYVEANLKTEQSPNVVVAPVDQLLLWQKNENGVINLQDYIADSQWGMGIEEIEEYYPPIWEQDSWEDRQLGLPALRTFPVLVYNKTWAEELGFSQPPATTAEFEEQVCAAAIETRLGQNDGTGGWIVNTAPLTTLNWLNAFGGINLADLDAEEYRFNTSESRAALVYLRTLFDEGCAWNSRISEPYEYFSSRKALIYSGTLDDIPTQAFTQSKNENADEWSVIPYPSDTAQQSFFIHGTSYAILVDGPEKQLASWLFIRWISDPERQSKLAFASGTLPVTQSAAESMEKDARINPQWKEVFPEIASAQSAPRSPSWPIARNILSDAAWQTFQPNAEIGNISTYLQQVDSTIREILARMN